MSRQVKISTDVNLTLTLEKTDTGKYPQAVVFTTTDSIVSTVSLVEVDSASYAGVYQGLFTTPSSEGDLYVVYKVYTDSGHSTEDTTQDYHATEELFVTTGAGGGSGSGAYSHTDTILETGTSTPIEGANVYIYSDSSRSTLVASTVTNALGAYTDTLYADAAGTYYRRIVASGRAILEDTVTFS